MRPELCSSASLDHPPGRAGHDVLVTTTRWSPRFSRERVADARYRVHDELVGEEMIGAARRGHDDERHVASINGLVEAHRCAQRADLAVSMNSWSCGSSTGARPAFSASTYGGFRSTPMTSNPLPQTPPPSENRASQGRLRTGILTLLKPRSSHLLTSGALPR